MTARARVALAIAPGDPAGIGPEVAVRAALARRAGDALVVFGDADRLDAIARASLPRVDAGGALELDEGSVAVAHVSSWSDAMITAHAPTAAGGRAQLAALDAAALAVREGRARALVTGPTSKEAIVLSGVPFVGQTEHLAATCGLEPDAVTMMFLGPRLRVALVTTHLAVRDVPPAITEARVGRTIRHLAEAIARLADALPPGAEPPWSRPLRVVVAGLNPHAGESGLFGDEEQRVVAPAIAAARRFEPIATGRVEIHGPRPAEAALREAADGAWDGVVAMMHDQATIASKLLDWGRAVNVTWGLPFLRTSVDHGVAYDAAARGGGSAEGMEAAIALAQALTQPQKPRP